MRALAAHNTAGEISSMVIGPPDGPPVAAMLESDQQVTVVDVPDDIINLIRESGDELQVLETLKAYRVELEGEARLVRQREAS